MFEVESSITTHMTAAFELDNVKIVIFLKSKTVMGFELRENRTKNFTKSFIINGKSCFMLDKQYIPLKSIKYREWASVIKNTEMNRYTQQSYSV